MVTVDDQSTIIISIGLNSGNLRKEKGGPPRGGERATLQIYKTPGHGAYNGIGPVSENFRKKWAAPARWNRPFRMKTGSTFIIGISR